MTREQVETEMAQYRTIFTVVRLLDAAQVGGEESVNSFCSCYSYWGKNTPCRNCISRQVLEDHRQRTKLEYMGSEVFQVTAVYREVDGAPCVMELVQKLDGETLIDPENGDRLIDSITSYHTKLYHDALTDSYNRLYFEDELKDKTDPAGVVVMDLDDFKLINDTYGHDWGDQYIRRTGQCLRDNTPAGTVCARLSGDEFLVLFHGYCSRDAVREKIDRLTNAMQQSVALLPSGNALHISLSGGIAWYPDDGQDWETLKKYADFAMYQVKHADKGRVEEFDIGVYNREAYAERTRREFRQLLGNAQVFYCFQPIFSARSGRVVAYEALMRSPATIMKLAREQGALYEIERITFTKALETFDSLCRAGSVSGDAMLFVNSIANTCLSHEDGKYINSHWHELCRRMVVEITEEEEIDYEALGFSGMFALDDYGSGYSNENTLLQLAPRFVKVDITIIRGIDTSPDKQQILRNMVAYAHPRSMKIVAEGVETAAELRTVIELGADLLQGYFLARPAIVPGDIAPEAVGIIQELQRRKKD